MSHTLHLSEGLSQALVAFTIEYDNEWETKFWLPLKLKPLRVSMVMWENFQRLVPKDGITLRELSGRAGYPEGKLHPSFAGMLRWRFVTATLGKKGRAGKTGKLDQIIEATEVGRQAAEFWVPLASQIEDRWSLRFGHEKVQELKEALVDLVDQFDHPLPRYFPVVGHLDGMRVPVPHEPEQSSPQTLALPNLLSMAIHRYTISFEEETEISLAQRANVLRVLSSEGISMRTVPQLAGISKEALKMAYGFLKKSGHLVHEPSRSGRGMDVLLTALGVNERDRFAKLQQAMEKRWEAEFSRALIDRVRSALDAILVHDQAEQSPLFEGLTPPPETWRAELAAPEVLPHQPMVLHRGGWPDGM